VLFPRGLNAGVNLRRTLKNAGTRNSVETVANIKPPITARPSGAFCSPPSPTQRAIGIMPMIMARAVIFSPIFLAT
jgi:hypothetical protein